MALCIHKALYCMSVFITAVELEAYSSLIQNILDDLFASLLLLCE